MSEKYKFNSVMNEVGLERLRRQAIQIGTFVVKDSKEKIRVNILTTKMDGPFLDKVHGPVGSFDLANFILEMFRLHNKHDEVKVDVSLRGLHRQLCSTESLRSIQEALLISHRNVFPNEI